MASIYKCGECGFQDEYINHIPSCRAPEKCPECGSDKFEQDVLETFKGIRMYDVPGGHAWQKKIDKINQAIVDPSMSHNGNPY